MGNGKKPDGTKPLYHSGFADKGKRIASFALDMIYPRRCPVCDDITAPRGRNICTKCVEKLVPVTGPRCYRCSKPLVGDEEEYCHDCTSKKHSYDRGIGIFPYGSVLSKSLYQLKYHQRQEYGRFYGKYAAAYAGEVIRSWNIEAVVPVPLHRQRLEKRGYNQAEIIARELAGCLGIPMESRIVRRVLNTRPQKELDDKERKRNIKKAFICIKEKLPWKNVLVVDDIYTTGSTIDGVSLALKRAGVQEVYFLTIAIGTGF